jgi:hypothetical protein
MDPAASTVSDLEARLRAMPAPRLRPEELRIVEGVLAGGFTYAVGLSLDGHRVLTRRLVERDLARARAAKGGHR